MLPGGNPGGASRLDESVGVVLRLKFRYALVGDASQWKRESAEALAILLPGGQDMKELAASMMAALESSGGRWPASPRGRLWGEVEVGIGRATLIDMHMDDLGSELTSFAATEDAMAKINSLAREAGERVAKEAKALGCERIEVAPGTTIIRGVAMAFETIRAQVQADETKRVLEESVSEAAGRPRRPAL